MHGVGEVGEHNLRAFFFCGGTVRPSYRSKQNSTEDLDSGPLTKTQDSIWTN